jgi:hypothetical protein
VARAPARAAHDDPVRGGRVEVDCRVRHAGRDQQPQVRQSREPLGVEARALAHRDDDLGARERGDQLVGVAHRLGQRLDGATVGEPLPRPGLERDILEVVEDDDPDRRRGAQWPAAG